MTMIKKLSKLITSMPASREKTIILLRYGLDGNKPMTQLEVAGKLNISRSYVSRIEKKALSDLRKKLEKQ